MRKLFIENPGIPISAETFIDRVWGTRSREEAQAVRAYIAFLRKKLDGLMSILWTKKVERLC